MIKFEKVKFKNFGSFGNAFTEINLASNNSTLICGSNGSGKSFAFLDSITFALFGKPFRKINIPQLANSINSKNCIVELEFTRGTDVYVVKRGINPRLFEIYKNDELVNQDAKAVDYQDYLEQQILKMNYKTFTQVVILGSSSFVPFMQLSAADRRSVIENILDINIFSTMNIVLKGKILSLKETIKELNTKIEIEKNKINVQMSYISTLEKKNAEDDDYKNEQINQLQNKIKDLQSDILSKRFTTNQLTKDIEDCKNTIKKAQDIIKSCNSHIATCTANKKQFQKEIDFFKENCTCPTCSQSISDMVKKEKILTNNYEISKFDESIERVNETIKEQSDHIELFELNMIKLRESLTRSSKIENEISFLEDEVKRINNTIQKSTIKNKILR